MAARPKISHCNIGPPSLHLAPIRNHQATDGARFINKEGINGRRHLSSPGDKEPEVPRQ